MDVPEETLDFAKLQRLNSLLFGSEIAVEKGDFGTALGFALRLVGFLESESLSLLDRTFIRPILKKAYLLIDVAKQATLSDRRALEQAGWSKSFLFGHCKSLDLDEIKSSKFWSPHYCRWNVGEEKTIDHTANSAKDGSDLAPRPAACRVERKSVEPASWEFSVQESGLKQGRGLLRSKISTRYGNASCSAAEKGRAHTTPVKDYEPLSKGHYTVAANGKFRSAPVNAPSDVSNSPPAEEDDEKNFVNSYGANRKRSRNPYWNKKSSENYRPTLKEEDSDDDVQEIKSDFITAKQRMAMDAATKKAQPSYHNSGGTGNSIRSGATKSLGGTRRGVRGSFVPPVSRPGGCGTSAMTRAPTSTDNGPDDPLRRCLELLAGPDGELPERLRNLEPKLLEHVSNEIMDQDPNVRWDDIAGLEHAKKCVTEMVIWPLLRPDIFQGCRAPGKGLLLFGPPGTGKTMIGKAIAGEAKATFFSISASSLTSKWIGEGEKLVRALFGVASCRQPAVIFIDEVDSLLSQRKADGEHESSRRLKTQFLIEMEGCGSGTEQILLIGATNRPQELDEAARRRLSKRLYIPLPTTEARAWIVRSLLQKDELLSLTDVEVDVVCSRTDGYSGSDMKNLVKEASMGPLREALMQGKDISMITKDEMRPISLEDFVNALQQIRPSVSENELGLYEDWNRQFGSLAL